MAFILVHEPIDTKNVTSAYGYRIHPITKVRTFHHGIDLSDGCDHEPIFAVNSGRVVTAAYNSGAGNHIVIDHGDGVKTTYMHLYRMLVSKGDVVEPGQIIGNEGTTGGSTGDHLHFQIDINGASTDPYPYLQDVWAGVDPNYVIVKPMVRLGDRGRYVEMVQAAVGATADGIFGLQTQAAVAAFQSANGLVADGIVGKLTWAAIDNPPATKPEPEPVPKKDYLNVVDVSGHQPLDILNNIPYDLAIVKLSEKTTLMDSALSHLPIAKKKGAYGIYHFDSGSDWRTEVDAFIRYAGQHAPDAVAFWDWEAKAINEGTERLANIRKALKEHFGYAAIYASGSVIKARKAEFDQWDYIWVASYSDSKRINYEPHRTQSWVQDPLLFQYSSSGQLGSYAGNLDINVAYCTIEKWNDIAASRGDVEVIVPTPAPKRLLSTGCSGDDVKILQGKLGVATDGVFGPKTKAALVAYQKANGLVADGIAGPKTYASMGL